MHPDEPTRADPRKSDGHDDGLHSGAKTYEPIFDTNLEIPGAGELVKEIAADVSTLVRKEIELARLELKEIVKDAVKALGLSGFAIALAALIIPLVILTLVEILAIWLPRWSATLMVTGLVGMVAALLFLTARRLFRKRSGSGFMHSKTVETIKEDLRWAKNRKGQ